MKKLDKTKVKILVLLSVFSAGILVISNIVAVKLWNFFGIAVDGGIAIFPLTYIIGDIMVELYGKKMANYVVYIGFGLNLLAALIFLLVGFLPSFPGWEYQSSYDAILGFTPRIVAGSLLAYLASSLLNNRIFEKIKNKTGEKKLWLRALGSSIPAKLVDNIIFKTIAFFGTLAFSDFLAQLIFAFVASIVLETLLTPLTYLIVGKLKKYAISDC